MFTSEGGALDGAWNERRQGKWWVGLSIALVSLVFVYGLLGPSCSRGMIPLVQASAAGSDFCLLEGGRKWPSILECYKTRDAASEARARIVSRNEESFRECNIKMQDHLSGGPIRRLLASLWS